MNRRGFLKACAIVSSGMIVIPSVRLILPDESLLSNEQWLANVRELGQYTIENDSVMIRHDMKAYDEQWFVEHYCRSPQDVRNARRMSAAKLSELMTERGWRTGDLVSLPIPRGIATNVMEMFG